jgi:uncharacterized DUF497 family protein
VLEFDWDDAKNAENKRKHRVAFEEAETVFYDERAVMVDDDDEAAEERLVLIGLSASLRVLVVCHTYRRREQLIRLISARKANRAERTDYERRWKR